MSFKKNICIVAVVAFLGFWANFGFALENPQAVVKTTVTDLQKEIAKQHASLENSPEKLYALVKKIVLPHIDVNYMAGLTLGSLWRGATEQQKAEFVDEFGLLLTRAYANALLKVEDYRLSFDKVSDNWQQKTFVSVSGKVQPKSGGQPSNVTYYLVKVNNEWRIYDMVIEGVSFLQNYRSQFQSFENLTSLIAKLKAKNAAEVS